MNEPTTGEMYAAYMQELKWRLGVIEGSLHRIAAAPAAQSSIFDAEFAYLQMRFVCELIALASLAAHHSYELSKGILKEWHPDQIFAELETVNEHCFPVPVVESTDEGGMLQFTPVEEHSMKRQDLKDIYGRLGNSLHRGFLKHALSGTTKTYDVDELSNWYRSLAQLLNKHMIIFEQEQRALLFNMHGGPDGRVMVVQAEAEGEFRLVRQETTPDTGS